MSLIRIILYSNKSTYMWLPKMKNKPEWERVSIKLKGKCIIKITNSFSLFTFS